MFVYAIKDNVEKLYGRGIFCAPNDGSARRMLAITIAREQELIGIKDKQLVCIGEFDENTGLIHANKDNVIRDVCPLKTIFDEVINELKPYVKK